MATAPKQATPLTTDVTPVSPTTPDIKASTQLVEAVKMPTKRPRAFYIASQWHIVSEKGSDMINAVNNNTGDKFEGTIANFNAMLRGDIE